MIDIEVSGRRRRVPPHTLLSRLAEEYQREYEDRIVLATVNGKLQELHKTVEKPAAICFVTTSDPAGRRAYERSMLMLANKAIYGLLPQEKQTRVIFPFSVTGGVFVRIEGGFTPDEEFLKQLRERMEELIRQDLPIRKSSVHVSQAMAFFHRVKMYDKENLFRYRRSSWVNIYDIDGFADYHYGYMVPSTGYLTSFDLKLYHDGFVLLLPRHHQKERVTLFLPQEKLFSIRREAEEWGARMNMATVGDINRMIAGGEAEDLILIAEARQEKKIADIAAAIAGNPKRKIILIAGPSSSGKTSFSHRLAIQLRALGLRPHPVAVDDYFMDREKYVRDENGNVDYESISCVDVPQLNADMNALLAGEEVALPTFNFLEGKRQYRGNVLKLSRDDILIIEGIHCLNDMLTPALAPDYKYKIYVSALTQLRIDEHNRIPTTDGRLIRRLIRDARTRGAGARETISRWPSVRRGEERNIFPYQETADVMFNSSLIYEFSVMKPYAEQLLFGIPEGAAEYQEAKRLLKFFDYFLTISSEAIPRNSLLKEFIGGSIFRV